MTTVTVSEFDQARARYLKQSAHAGELVNITFHGKEYARIVPSSGWSVLPDDELAELHLARDERDALREELEQLRQEPAA